tara:strand:+ start:507 stop:818 length:312 start_codon:yes stop_codon:yes gene_type:complete
MAIYDNTSHEATDLYLYAINDADLYRQRESIEKNLQRKYDKGIYDSAKAAILWRYFADNAAKKYHADFCGNGKWFHLFTASIRREVAELAEKDHRELMNERAE